jgi:hypothetical protein
MSMELSGEITAIATAALAFFAIITAYYARRAFIKQSQEVGILIEDSRRQADERRTAQAARVFIGIPEPPPNVVTHPYVKNASDSPIYNVQLWDHGTHGLDDHKDLGIIMPGEKSSVEITFLAAGTRTFLTFQDGAGIRWIRVPGGGLREQSRATPADSILAITRTDEAGWVILMDETG